jgi:hypothetical protein
MFQAFDDDLYAARAQPYIFEEHFHGKGLTYAGTHVFLFPSREIDILQIRRKFSRSTFCFFLLSTLSPFVVNLPSRG